jgi:hypothetical protein
MDTETPENVAVIAAVVSGSTRALLDETVAALRIDVDRVVEDALLSYLYALRALPSDVLGRGVLCNDGEPVDDGAR